MKIKNITIGIKSVKEGLHEFAGAVEAMRRGEPPCRKRDGVYFVSLEAMRKVLTPKRLELLHIIRESRPESIYALVQIAKRDLKNVQDDVSMLARVGLVSLSRAGTARKRIIPKVEYDRLQLQIPVI